MKLLEKLFGIKNLQDSLKQVELDRVELELNILKNELDKTMKFFKNSARLPLYMVMGYSRFGKTTLLSKSGVKVVDVLGDAVSPLPTKYFSWFFSEDAIYLDTAGSYAQTDKDAPHFSLVWIGFLKLLKKYFNNLASGLIVVIDIPTLSGDKEKLDKVLNDLRERIYEVAKYSYHLPVYVVFTKSDLIPGFVNFFETLSNPQRDEPFGIVLKASKDIAENKVKKLNTKLDYLFDLLYDKSVQRLYQEPEREKHFDIVNFPLQLENMRDSILEVAKVLPDGGSIDLTGMYFTSSVQVGVPVDILERRFLRDFNLQSSQSQSEENYYNAVLPSAKKTYFIHDLFKKIIIPHESSVKAIAAASSNANKIISILAVLLLTLLSFFTWDYAYNNTIEVMSKVQAGIDDYKQTNDLNKVFAIIQDLSYADRRWWSAIGFSQIESLSDGVKNAYIKAIAKTFSLELQTALESTIDNARSTSNPDDLYKTIKVYLMLAGQERMDAAYVQNWFAKYWSQNYRNYPEKQQHLNATLAMALTKELKIKANQLLINDVKSMLIDQSIPKVDSVYLNLESKYKDQQFILKFPGNDISVSKMYTAENFDHIYNKDIIKAVNTVTEKNKKFILDKDDENKIELNHEKLISTVKAEYLQHYAAAWANALRAVKIDHNDTSDVKQQANFINDILNSTFPVIPLLKAVQSNTVIKDAPEEFTQMVSSKFHDINSIDLNVLSTQISNLSSYLNYIVTSGDVDKHAFTAALERYQNGRPDVDVIGNFKQFAVKQPYPVQSWLESIALDSWHSILVSTQNYINSVWSSSVIPEFKTAINNNYPISKDSLQSITVANFTRFFGPRGTMDSFFNYYIKPFVDTSQVYWVWREVDGQHLNIAQSNLELFIKAELVQKMFTFGNNDLTTTFTITPIEMSPNTQFFMLNLGNHFVSYHGGQKKSEQVFWSAQNNQSISIEFVNNQGVHVINSVNKDPWALLRILDKANIHPIADQQHFELTFDLNGNSIRYQLISDQPVNPFIPEILNNFKCPDKL